MEYVRLGTSGLSVSRVIFGCMSFGDPAQRPWSLTEEQARPFYREAVEAGITTFDTANAYSTGVSERITGKLLTEYSRRDDVVIATKVFFRMHDGPKGGGLSRAAIFAQCDASLRRLGTDYIDLYQIHRYDPDTPIEETLQALHDLVRSGKVRYLGASSMWTWQFVQAQYLADLHGWTRFTSMQDHYNLLQREEEREMHPFCLDQGVGVIPWSPLARGRLTRDWDETTTRGDTDGFTKSLYGKDEDADRAIVKAVAEVAADRGVSRAQVALAWVLAKPAVTAPIFGATKIEHLRDAIAAVDLRLSAEEIARLEEPYEARRPEGF